ncbi:aminotransferase class III-fold pyridoxal phosphate-dependent enzyme [bacterium]|nr:aminotransferase class III-fold pyridoxal phosphate-dependent enzyme [bacterium]
MPDTTYPDISQSDALWARAQGLIPRGTQTLAKGPGQFSDGVAPKYLRRGEGCRVWDVDGNEYVDLNMGIGPISLGYCYPRVDEAVRAQLAQGMTFSLMHPLEVEVAELIRDVVPNAESVRFSKTGADVVSAAIRTARAHTGRDTVLCCGYHGWHDWYISVTDKNKGVPGFNQKLVYTLAYDDLDHLARSLDDRVAAVVLEPVVFQKPSDGYLAEVARLCRENGTLLIFDEMWTGFRMALGGAQEHFGVTPDLACYSKAVANGMPVAVLAGRRDVMQVLDDDVFFYTTFGGEALSLAAAKATVEEMREKDVQAFLATQGAKFQDGYNAIVSELGLDWTACIGYPWRSLVKLDGKVGNPLFVKALLQQEMIARGVLWGGFHNVCFTHDDAAVDRVLSAYRDALPGVAAIIDRGITEDDLRGAPLEPVFRKTSNFNVHPRS